MSQALNKASKQLLVDLINETNGKNFALTDLIFGTPQRIGDRPRQNTVVQVNLATKPDAADSISVFYNRINFGAMFADKLIQIVDDGSFTSTDDFIPYLNSTYGLGLAAEDLVVSAVTVGTKPFPVHVFANPASLAYTGQFQIVLVTTIADPTPDIASTDQILGDAFQQANSDKLFIDGMLDDGHFTKTIDITNGTILALRSRSEDAGPLAPALGSADYTLADVNAVGGNWHVDYALQFDMAAREGYVTDYYDVSCVLTRTGDAAESLTLTLSQTNGVFSFGNGTLSLPADYSYERGTQLQGEFDMALVAAATEWSSVFGYNATTNLDGVNLNADGAPVGDTFSFKMVANRKGDADDMHNVSINTIIGA